MHAFATLFEQARALPENDRAAFLEGACKGDAALREKIERMLSAAAQADAFFGEDSGDEGDPTLMMAPVSEGPGTIIGRYKLLQKIGEGGMGIVYMAEQSEPVRRKVALKIIKVGMDTRRVIARFEAERQALAMMDHPNIAHVLDGGATESGRPYFVMELVQGVPITEFCDKGRLTARERIDLFIPVCQAIQSAHQKGIIHRDIKPSNVLVTLNHGEPVPKVIDFGIAKATNQKLTEKTLFTNFATMIGTPAYMSPEQAELSSMDVDTRADVYSLGVLLYELLTGSTPFPEKRLRSVGYGEMQRIILEEDPPKPSERLRTMTAEEKTTLSRTRGINAPAFDKLLKGDLDWIVMKCLEKDRRRRYDGPNELAADLRRHLGNEPVSAVAPSFGYQLAKLYQRNRAAVGMAGVIVVILILATVVSGAMAVRAKNAEKAKALEAAKAKDQAGIAQEVNRFLNEDLLGQAAPQAGGKEITVREVLDRAAQKIESQFKDKPVIEAAIRNTIGSAYYNIGRWELAEPHLRRAVELQEKVAAGESDAILTPLLQVAEMHCLAGRSDLAEPIVERIHNVYAPMLAGTNVTRLRTLVLLGVCKAERKDEEGLPMLKKAYGLYKNALGPRHPETLKTASYLCRFLPDEDGRALVRELGGKEGLGPASDPNMFHLHNTWNEMVNSTGDVAKTEAAYKEMAESLMKAAPEHPHSLVALHLYAFMLSALNKNWEEQERIYKRVHAAFVERWGADHYKSIAAEVHLGRFYLTQAKRLDLAEPLLLDAYERSSKLKEGPAEELASNRVLLAENLAGLHRQRGEFAEAARFRREILPQKILAGMDWTDIYYRFSTLEKAHGGEEEAWKALRANALKFSGNPLAWHMYSGMALGFGRLAEAEFCLEEMEKKFPNPKDRVINCVMLQTALLLPGATNFLAARGEDLAKPLFEASANPNEHDWGKAWRLSILGLFEYRRGNFEKSLDLVRDPVFNAKDVNLVINGGYSMGLTVKALAEFGRGDLGKAKALLAEASQFPKDDPTKWHARDKKLLPPDVLRYLVLREEAVRLLGEP